MIGSYFDRSAATWDDNPGRIAIMKVVGAAILREAQPTKAMDVLDYGCGTGLISLFLLPHIRSVTGADNSSGMLERIREKITAGQLSTIRAVRMDLEKDAVPENRYHMVVVGMAMHHIADVDKTLSAFHEMLLPGGVLCIADLDTEPGTFHPASVAGTVHHHGFDRKGLKDRLSAIGFGETKDVTVSTLAKPTENGKKEEFSIFLITARRP